MNTQHHDILLEVRERLVRIEEKMENVCLTTQKHDKLLYGNGKMGLKTMTNINWWVLTAVVTLVIGVAIRAWN